MSKKLKNFVETFMLRLGNWLLPFVPVSRKRMERRETEIKLICALRDRDVSRKHQSEIESIKSFFAHTEKNNTEKPLVYLACPYSHPERKVKIERFNAANRAAGRLLCRGEHVFSPISHTHPIANECDLPGGWEFWKKFDSAYLSISSKLYVLQLNGWKESKGVNIEIEIAKSLDISIEFLNADFGSFDSETARGVSLRRFIGDRE